MGERKFHHDSRNPRITNPKSVQEEQSRGQAIRKYSVEARLVGGEYVPVSSGTSVGNKKIDLLQADLAGAAELRLNILYSAAPTVHVKRFAAFKCAQPTSTSMSSDGAERPLPTITVIT